jgi:PD-(D/E)XK endonuclease
VTTNQKGAIAETAIIHAAVKLGIGVFKPIMDERYDLVFDLRHQLVRVQCKWAMRQGEIVVVPCYSNRRGPAGMIRRSYTNGEIDAFAAYCDELKTCYFIPIDRFPRRSAVSLRLSPARNNQRTGINWAEDFEFEATLGRLLGP